MEDSRGGSPALMLHDDAGDSSREPEESGEKEWEEETLKFLVDMCVEKYREYNRKPFKQADWEFFARQLNTRFPEESQRTWQQTRDEREKMKTIYEEEKAMQLSLGTRASPSPWTPWYEIFDSIFGDVVRIISVHHGVDQGARVKYFKVHIVSDDDDVDERILLDTLPPPSATRSVSSHSPHTKAITQSGCERQVNKCVRKRKRQLDARDEAIASAITNFSKRILEMEKRKLQMMEKLIDAQNETREMVLKGQLQMATLIVEALKAKDSSSSSK